MSFLPYAQRKSAAWWVAGSGSALVHAGLIGLAIASAQGLVSLAATLPEPEPRFTITLTPLNSDTIAGLTLQDGTAGTDDDDGLDTLTAFRAPETLAARVPSATSTSTTRPDTLTALSTEREPTAATPERIAPAAQSPKSSSPVMPTTVMPRAAQSPLGIASIEPLRPTRAQPPEQLAANAPETITAMRPSAPTNETAAQQQAPVAQTATRSAQDLAVDDLLRRIRSAPSEPCFLALPRRDGDTGVGLALIASAEDTMTRFTQNVLTADDTDLRQTRTLVDERQCAALNYIRQNQDYPATRLGLRLDNTLVLSGGRLTGSLRGTAGRYLTLMLIDNNGVVQDLQRFLTFSGTIAQFDVPVTRDGPLRDTGQILLAIATRRPAPILRDRAGRLAADVFNSLTGPIVEGAALGIAIFDVAEP